MEYVGWAIAGLAVLLGVGGVLLGERQRRALRTRRLAELEELEPELAELRARAVQASTNAATVAARRDALLCSLRSDEAEQLARQTGKRVRAEHVCVACGRTFFPRGRARVDRCSTCGGVCVFMTPTALDSLPELRDLTNEASRADDAAEAADAALARLSWESHRLQWLTGLVKAPPGPRPS